MRRMNSSEEHFYHHAVPYREHHSEYLANYLITGKRGIIGKGRDVMAVRKDGTQLDIHISVSEMQIGPSKNIRA